MAVVIAIRSVNLNDVFCFVVSALSWPADVSAVFGVYKP